MANDMGFEAHDDAGHVGYADLAETSRSSWASSATSTWCRRARAGIFEPYQVTRKDGYLLGRGVIDDKGPSV